MNDWPRAQRELCFWLYRRDSVGIPSPAGPLKTLGPSVAASKAQSEYRTEVLDTGERCKEVLHFVRLGMEELGIVERRDNAGSLDTFGLHHNPELLDAELPNAAEPKNGPTGG